MALGPSAIRLAEVKCGGVNIPFDPKTPARLHVARSPFPLEDGTEIYRIESRYRNQPDVDMDPYFRFEIAFGEPGIFEGKPLIEGLLQLANATNGIIGLFFETLRELW
jgi:hypothetical protein